MQLRYRMENLQLMLWRPDSVGEMFTIDQSSFDEHAIMLILR